MGIIRAITGAAGSVLKEQWLEYFSCDALDSETLIRRGVKRIGARSENTRTDDNIITNGSILSVAQEEQSSTCSFFYQLRQQSDQKRRTFLF